MNLEATDKPVILCTKIAQINSESVLHYCTGIKYRIDGSILANVFLTSSFYIVPESSVSSNAACVKTSSTYLCI